MSQKAYKIEIPPTWSSPESDVSSLSVLRIARFAFPPFLAWMNALVRLRVAIVRSIPILFPLPIKKTKVVHRAP